MTTGSTHLLRVWLPDRPGALGAVASRVGAVKGDLLGIEIVERGGGMVIDELLVHLPLPELVDLLIRELSDLEDVTVEDVEAVEAPCDPTVDALTAAAAIAGCASLAELGAVISDQLMATASCDWVSVIDHNGVVVATAGTTPALVWITAFAEGARAARLLDTAPSDAVSSIGSSTPFETGDNGRLSREHDVDAIADEMPSVDYSIVVGRESIPFRSRERRLLAGLVNVADATAARLARSEPGTITTESFSLG